MSKFLTVFVVVVVFAAVMLSMQGFYWYYITQKEKESKELARRLGTVKEDNREVLFKIENKRKKADDLGDLGGQIAASLEDMLAQAGNPFTYQNLIGAMVGTALVGMLLLVIVTKSPLGFIGVVFGYVPVVYLRFLADARNDALTEQLPDALDLMARSLQAGHGIAESMRVCAEEMKMPVSGEFGRVYEENNLGRDFRDCLNALIQRNPGNFDLKIFVSSILLQRETGGNLVEILESISGTIRERFIFKGKVAALTAEAKFSAIILGALPFFVSAAIYTLRPEYLDPLFNDPLGNLILAFVIVWFSSGVFVMRELTKVEI